MSVASLAELRSLLHATPSAAGWGALTAALTLWPDREQLSHEVLPYVDGALARWPDSLRVTPADWLRAQRAGEDTPALCVCRTLQLPFYADGLSELAELLAHPHLATLSALELGWGEPAGPALVSTLLRMLPAHLALRALALPGAKLDASLVDWLIRWQHTPRLERLDLSENMLDAASATRLLSEAPLDALTTLDLSAQAPAARSISAGFEEVAAALGALPRLRALSLDQLELGRGTFAALAAPGRFASLRELSLRGNLLRLDAPDTLARASFWPALDHLDLARNSLFMGWVERLCDALRDLPRPAALALELSGTGLGDRAVEALLPGLDGVGELRLLGDCGLYGESLVMLAQAPHALRELHIALGHSCDEAMVALAQRPMPALRALTIESPLMGEPGCAAVLGSDVLEVRRLTLRGIWSHQRSVTMMHAQLDDESAARWRPGQLLASLESLELELTGLPTRAMEALLHDPRAARLKSLRMTDTRSLARSFDAPHEPALTSLAGIIARSQSLTGLAVLHVSNHRSGSAACAALISAPQLTALRWLSLSVEDADDEALLAFVRGSGLPALTRLHLHYARSTPATQLAAMTAPRLAQLTDLHIHSDHVYSGAVDVLLERVDLDPQLRLQWEAQRAERQRQLTAAPRGGAITRPLRALRDLFNR